MSTNGECLICGINNSVVSYTGGASQTKDFTCPNCGKFSLARDVWELLEGKSMFPQLQEFDIGKAKSALFYYLRVIVKNHLKKDRYIYFIRYDITSDDNPNYTGSFVDIYKLYPEDFSKRMQMTMELWNTVITDIGEYLDIRTKHSAPVFRMPSGKKEEDRKRQAIAMLRYLEEADYVKEIPTYHTYDFTIKGWEYINSLKRFSSNSDVAFIAISFNKENELILKAEECIKQAIRDAGYMPLPIKDKEHNNYIMAEIIHEIKNSAFVIADLTEQNNGVYFEAGYAKAIGKEVIFTCPRSELGKVHFDTKQISMILWDTEEEFKTSLVKRIEVTVGLRNV